LLTPRNLEGVRVTRDTEVDLKVIRIVCNIESQDLAQAQGFYGDILGLDLMMDLGWIRTYGSKETKPVQISMLSEGGSGTPVPDLSIEVDDIKEALCRIRGAKLPIEYGPADEPWGVRRFYVRDPFGKLINVLAHT
jgi:catechol 2,3-dioxygenase-like lactoylglutathione lyase family enzyme